MENQINITISVLIAALGIAGSCVAAFVVLKVGVAETKKDVLYQAQKTDDITQRLTRHVEGPSHPTADQISHLRGEIAELKKHISTTYERIEDKVDELMAHALRAK